MLRRLAWISLCAAPLAAAQDVETEAERRRALAAELVDGVAAVHDCSITLHGEPRFDEFAGYWLVAYSASGSDCDEAAEALQRQGTPLDIAFFRRPDRAQVAVLITEARRAVEAAFGCRIVLRGEPRLNEASGYWTVPYVGSGSNCADAHDELMRRGRELQIYFVGGPDRIERFNPLLPR